MGELYRQNEILWQQRSIYFWLRDGDKNTKYFHNALPVRKRNNCIHRIRDTIGSWVQGSEMVDVFVHYFEYLFSTSNPSDMNSMLQLLDCRVKDAMRLDLDRDFSAMDVKNALDQTDVGKSPGPNGLSGSIFKKN